MTCNRLVDNIVDSRLFVLNDGRVTRIPGVSIHKATAIDVSLVIPGIQLYTPSRTLRSASDTLFVSLLNV